MRTLCFFVLFAAVCTHVSGQQMQEFNQLYFEKEFQKKVAKALNGVKAVAGAQTAADQALKLNDDGTVKATLTEEEEKAAKKALEKEGTSGDTQVNKVSGLPAFTDLLGNDVILPKIEINGTTNFNSEAGFYGDVKLFTSGVSAKQTNYTKVFFTETSTYGVSMSMSYLPGFATKSYKKLNGQKQDEAKWACIYLGANYLGKNLYGTNTDNGVTDTTKFTSAFGHMKYGIQLIPFKNLLSFYVDANHIVGLTNRDPLKKYAHSLSNGFTNFLNVGTKFLLANDAEEKPLNMFVDISGVVMSSSLKKVYNTTDKIILRVSIGGAIRF